VQSHLVESHKLDPWPLDEGPRPKSSEIEAKPRWHHFEGIKSMFYAKSKISDTVYWSFVGWHCKTTSTHNIKIICKIVT
jgi:hypothetical protein